MTSPVDSLVVLVAGASALGLALMFFANARRLIGRLELSHHVLWLSMGCPSAFFWTLSRGGDRFTNVGANRVSLTVWLSDEGYLDLNDPVITKLVRQRDFLGRVSLALIVALIGYGAIRYSGLLASLGGPV